VVAVEVQVVDHHQVDQVQLVVAVEQEDIENPLVQQQDVIQFLH
tara:strand:- start:492 stop:623 length:132 start_codon:yes stop_codon:yes gene_type:complete